MAILKDTILVATATLGVGSALMEIPTDKGNPTFNKLFPYVGTFISAGIGYYFLRRKGYIKASEYQPSQEMDDYSLNEIAKSSAIEGFEPMKFSVVGNRAEGLETIFDAEGSFGDKPSINISWKTYIDAKKENKDKLDLFNYLKQGRVLAMKATSSIIDKKNIQFDVAYPMADMNFTTMDLRGYFDFNGGRFFLIKYNYYVLKDKVKRGQSNFMITPSYLVIYRKFDDYLNEERYEMVSGASNSLSRAQLEMVQPAFNGRPTFKNQYKKVIEENGIAHLGFSTGRKEATSEALQFLYFNCLTPVLELDFDESLQVASNDTHIESFQNMIIPYTYKVKDKNKKTRKITNYYYVDEYGKCKFFIAISIDENGMMRFMGDTKTRNGVSLRTSNLGAVESVTEILEYRPILKYWLKSVVMDSANLSKRRINMWNTDREKWLKQQYVPMLSAKWLPVLFSRHTSLIALDYIKFMKSCLVSSSKFMEDSPATHLSLINDFTLLDDNVALELFKKYFSSKEEWETLALLWNGDSNPTHIQFYNKVSVYEQNDLRRFAGDFNYQRGPSNLYSILDTLNTKNTIVPIASWFGSGMPNVLPLEISNTKDLKVRAFRKIYNKYEPMSYYDWVIEEQNSYYTNEEFVESRNSYDPKEMTIEPNPYEMLKNMIADPMNWPNNQFVREETYNDEMEAESSKPHSVTISRSSNSEKKLMAVFEDSEGKKIKTTHFGQRGASDYTKHGDKERMERYLERHGGGTTTSTKEDWKDPTTAGALSRWLLWNKPSLSASFSDYKSRFGLKGTLNVSKSAEERKCKVCEKPATVVVQEGSFCYDCLPINLGAEYEAKSPAQESLDDWNDEDWKTKSGKPSGETGERFLPTKAIEALTDKEYKETSDKKRKDSKKGKQFSEQPKSIAEKTAKYRAESFNAQETPKIDIDDFNKVADAFKSSGLRVTLRLEEIHERDTILIIIGLDAPDQKIRSVKAIMKHLGYSNWYAEGKKMYSIVGNSHSKLDYIEIKVNGGHQHYRAETFEAIEGTGSKARFTDTPDSKVYRDAALRQKARNKVLKGTKGGNAGQWSAIKANLSATEYRNMYENKYGEGKNPYF